MPEPLSIVSIPNMPLMPPLPPLPPRQRAKLEKILGSIADLTRLPAALFVVDVMKEKIAVREALRLGIPVFAMVDTNSDPEGVDFLIPANDDASQSIRLIVRVMCDAIVEGLNERKVEREKEGEEEEEEQPKARRSRKSAAKYQEDVDDVTEETDEEETDEESDDEEVASDDESEGDEE